MQKRFSILVALCFALGLFAKPPMQTKVTFKHEAKQSVSIQYLLYLPEDYDTKQDAKWPLLVFLHGAGERGDDIDRVKVHGSPMLIEKGKHFPFIIVSPQCPRGQVWETTVLDAMLDDLIRKHRIDTTRLYLTGLSMGGTTAHGAGAFSNVTVLRPSRPFVVEAISSRPTMQPELRARPCAHWACGHFMEVKTQLCRWVKVSG